MCRLAAYVGRPRALGEVVIDPSHSLLAQSKEALEAKLSVNGDGFGIAWYGAKAAPGLYRDVLPAWSDGNLTSLCEHITSGHFLAHVRASTEGETARTNCHPFVLGRWSFMHNGQIGAFPALRRRLEASLSDDLYAARRGTTDSELLFLLLLNAGLATRPREACDRVLHQLYAAAAAAAVAPFFRLTCVFSDGERLFGFRHASDGRCPSLYRSDQLVPGGSVIASEPLDGAPGRWTPIEPDQLISIGPSSGSTATPLAGRPLAAC